MEKLGLLIAVSGEPPLCLHSWLKALLFRNVTCFSHGRLGVPSLPAWSEGSGRVVAVRGPGAPALPAPWVRDSRASTHARRDWEGGGLPSEMGGSKPPPAPTQVKAEGQDAGAVVRRRARVQIW